MYNFVIKKTFTFILIFCFTCNYGQNKKSGTIHYGQKLNSTEIVNKDKLSKDVLAFMKKDIENLKENSSKIDFVLKFNEYESLFKAKKIMDNDSGVKSKRAILASDSDGIWYYNSRENRFSRSKRIFEKKFTIIDTVNSKDWKILNEEKRTGNYLCIKAVKKNYLTMVIFLMLSAGLLQKYRFILVRKNTLDFLA